MFEAVDGLVAEHRELEQRLADPSIHADQTLARRLNQRYAELSAIVRAYQDWQRLVEDAQAAHELVREDVGFAEEAAALDERLAAAEERLRHLLVPRDPADAKDAIVEIKSGEGGEESALFAGDLLRMYTRHAERHGWKTEIIDSTLTGLGGVKDATMAVKAGKGGTGAWSRLKYEGGVHRVQRVPVTESQGRIHTSAAGVLVTPEADPVDVQVNDNDLRIDVYRSSGPGGQSVNTTDSAVRITHMPSGLVVSQQDEKSQHKNKAKAMKVLRARLYDLERAKLDAARAQDRKSQIGTGDRSERIRTYNFPQGRVTDHRINLTLYKIDKVMSGEALDEFIDALLSEDQAARLAEVE